MTEIGQETALQLEHRYAAPRDQVFDAWTNPEVLKRWWAAALRGERRSPRSTRAKAAGTGSRCAQTKASCTR